MNKKIKESQTKEKFSIVHEYVDYHNKYEKKYGKNKTFVLMQVGSFYEAYSTNQVGPNLQHISELLNIIYTRKDKSISEISMKNPYMLGFPIISFGKFINILIEAGYTIIIIDQVTQPPNPKREVTNIYSPGTYIEGPVKTDNNYITCIYLESVVQKTKTNLLCAGMSAIDLTTGKLIYHEAYSIIGDEKYGLDEVSRFINSLNPREILINYKTNNSSFISKEKLFQYLEIENKMVHYKENDEIDKKYEKISFQTELLKKVYKECGSINPIEYLEITKYIYSTYSITLLLDFIYEHSEKIIKNISKPELYFDVNNLVMGNNAIQQLNIIESNGNQYENHKIKSLFDVVNNTRTAMGRRYLREKLVSPMVKHNEITKYHDLMELLMEKNMYQDIENKLKQMTDIERLERKIRLNIVQPYELASQYNNILLFIELMQIIKNNKKLGELSITSKEMKETEKIIKDLEVTFNIEELKKQNLVEIQKNIFNTKIHEDIDEIHKKLELGDNYMASLCDELSKLLPDTKSKFNKDSKISIKKNDRDGYYLALSRIRSQALQKNIKDLKEIKIGNTNIDPKKLIFDDKNKATSKITYNEMGTKSDEIIELKLKLDKLCKEYLIKYISEEYSKYNKIIDKIINLVASIDYLVSNVITAKLYNYKKPTIINKECGSLECKQLRHPIVERLIDYEYIPHDISIGKELKGMLIYGLNSSGKTVLQKSIGICIVMAQAGMYVPAQEASISPYKSLYTRMTGSDNIFKGLSSFALEMLELKAILRRSGAFTLVIGDEICRGTEHISGNAIVATSIIELEKSQSSFIFATHLHEIANMERIKKLTNVKAYHISVEYDPISDTLIYDRKLKEGSGETIYGITVAKYILNDINFINTAMEIKEEITKTHNSMISGKTSKYNSEVYIHECQICNKKDTTGMISNLQTHHINFQKDCKDGFAKNKPHIRKNDKANLIVVCVDCHNKVHNDNLEIGGYVMTSKGKKVLTKNQ
jgi:DNA mismatch repair protein MutS